MKNEEIKEYLKVTLAETMNCDTEDIDENTSFFKLGVTSIQALKVINKMRKALEIEINPVAIFEYKCIAELAEYMESCL